MCCMLYIFHLMLDAKWILFSAKDIWKWWFSMHWFLSDCYFYWNECTNATSARVEASSLVNSQRIFHTNNNRNNISHFHCSDGLFTSHNLIRKFHFIFHVKKCIRKCREKETTSMGEVEQTMQDKCINQTENKRIFSPRIRFIEMW